MKKITTIGIILLFVGMAFTPTTGFYLDEQFNLVTLNRDTLYVGGTGTGNYSTVQEAINNAGDGDTVFVYDDSSPYYENVIVNKSINLIGEDKDSTVIDGNMIGDVFYVSADWVNISGFTIQNTSTRDEGIEIISNHITIADNNFVSHEYVGIYSWSLHTSYNNISGNYFTQSRAAIRLRYSDNYIISDNNIVNTGGIHLSRYCSNNSISNNYIIGTGDTLINNDIQCNNNSIVNNFLSNGSWGIRGDSGSNYYTNISYNIINNCDLEGIHFQSFNKGVIHGNSITNGRGGIYLRGSNSNMISCNVISNCSIEGIYVRLSSANTIFDNTLTSNYYGLSLYELSNFNTIIDNVINSNNGYGIILDVNCNGNAIFDNNVSFNNGSAIRMKSGSDPSSNNIIYHNNFINNSLGGHDECSNIWDYGYPSGGNYWSDYNGTDMDGDGIGDTPYNLSGGDNQDRYPLMYLWGEHPPVANYTYLILGDGGILFDGSSSYDRDGVIVLYEWDFDDGTSSQKVVVTHAYNESGTYDVTLTLTDDDGYQGSYARSIEAEKNHPPSAPLIDGPIEAKAGKSHFYNFTSEDPEEADVSYYNRMG
ncbi:parallel beta-helix repeat (two copies) [Thermoplasmatales archaeon SCGC AB-540-F20]|nr:parallel beta-helix repeat (two copies) [Thermoplasmatales archaeon SCGC AB-540-F20]